MNYYFEIVDLKAKKPESSAWLSINIFFGELVHKEYSLEDGNSNAKNIQIIFMRFAFQKRKCRDLILRYRLQFDEVPNAPMGGAGVQFQFLLHKCFV